MLELKQLIAAAPEDVEEALDFLEHKVVEQDLLDHAHVVATETQDRKAAGGLPHNQVDLVNSADAFVLGVALGMNLAEQFATMEVGIRAR